MAATWVACDSSQVLRTEPRWAAAVSLPVIIATLQYRQAPGVSLRETALRFLGWALPSHSCKLKPPNIPLTYLMTPALAATFPPTGPGR